WVQTRRAVPPWSSVPPARCTVTCPSGKEAVVLQSDVGRHSFGPNSGGTEDTRRSIAFAQVVVLTERLQILEFCSASRGERNNMVKVKADTISKTPATCGTSPLRPLEDLVT